MQIPDFRKLREDRTQGKTGCFRYCPGYHPNPYFFKYYWWVFHKDSPCDGQAFLKREHRLNYAAAMALLKELENSDELCWLYNEQLPRRDLENAPWDPDSPAWEHVEWAPPFEEDPDSELDGYK